MNAWWRTAFFLCLFFASGLAPAEVPVPPLQQRVTDLTGTLPPQHVDELETLLREFEARKGSQIAVLLVPSTQPEAIEQYAIRVVERWKLGRKGVDDGVLLLVAKEDRAMRIEVGYGLEGAIPDAVAKRIVSEIIEPYFKQNDFNGGIRAGVDAMIRIMDGEKLPPASAKDEPEDNGGSFNLLFLVLAGASFMRLLFGLAGALLAGGAAGFLSWQLTGSILAGIFVAVLTVVFSFGNPLSFIPGTRGGGGFSGGGGGFGGGGASGRW